MPRNLTAGFGMVSNTVMRDPEFSLRDKAVYAVLSTYADNTGVCYVGLNRLSSECGVDHSTLKRILKILKEKGAIERISRGLNSSITILKK